MNTSCYNSKIFFAPLSLGLFERLCVRLIFIPIFFASSQQFPFHHYSTSDGLSQNFINAITQDSRGFIWIGTAENGLNRFDGKDFTVFDLRNGLTSNGITALASDRQHLYIGTSKGVMCLKTDEHVHDTPDTTLNIFLKSIKGSIEKLQSLSEDVLYVQTKEKSWLVNFLKRDIKPADRQKNISLKHSSINTEFEIRDAAGDSVDGFWFATNKGLLFSSNNQQRIFNSQNGLAVEDVRVVMKDVEGNIWCGTSDGLFCYAPNRIQSLTSKDGLPQNSMGVWRISESPDGSIWFGTIGGGAVQFRSGKIIRKITAKDGLASDYVSDIYIQSTDKIIFATSGGVSFRNGKEIRNLTMKDGLPSNNVEYIIQSKHGGFWFSTHNGLVLYENGKIKTFTIDDGLPSNRISQIAEDQTGALWIGTHAGACVLRLDSLNKIESVSQLKGAHVVSVFIDRKNNPWFGTMGAGVYALSTNKLLHLTREDGLGGNTVYFISQDSSNEMYFGTNGGVTSFTESNLRFPCRVQIVPDSSEQWWNPNTESDIALNKATSFYTYTTALGLAGNEMNSGAVCIDRNNNLWFGSIGGVTRFTPRVFPMNVSRQKILLTRLQIGNRDVVPTREVYLGPGDEVLLVQCVLPTFRNSGQAKFLYRMDGMEYTWHESKDGRMMYTGLKAGNYRLVVCATIGEGIWSEQKELFTLTIAPYFYETTLFWFTTIVFLMIVGYSLHRYRTNRLLELERMRTRIASDLHDDIGATLSSISLLSDLEQRTRTVDDPASHERLSRISTLVRTSIDSMKDIVWAVNPKNDTVQSLCDRMRDFAQTASSASNIAIDFHVDESLASQVPKGSLPKMNAEPRKNIFMIFKEATNNAIKHSHCSKIDSSLTLSQRHLMLRVKDNGIGFNVMKVHLGNGLKSMKQRVEMMKGEIEIRSGEEGTEIIVSIPR